MVLATSLTYRSLSCDARLYEIHRRAVPYLGFCERGRGGERRRREVRGAGSAVGVPLPPGEVSGHGAVPLPRICF